MASTIKLKNGSGAPTSGQLVQGEPALDLTNKRLYTENASGTVIEVGTNPAAEITANAGIALPDNQKATFGAGDDLQIYHDSNNSFIKDVGTGDLYIAADNLRLTNAAATEFYAKGVTNGAFSLYYDGSAKLATTATGIDVTGTATVSGDLLLGSNGRVRVGSTGSLSTPTIYLDTDVNTGIYFPSVDTVGIVAGGVSKLEVNSTGIDVTGTVTADGLTVDGVARIEETGAAARLVIARADNTNSADSASLDLLENASANQSFGAASAFGFRLEVDGSTNKFNIVSGNGVTTADRFTIGRDTGDISFYEDTGTTAKFFWDASAESLGIGGSNPSSTYGIDVSGKPIRVSAAAPAIEFQETDAANQRWSMFSIGGDFTIRDITGGGYPLYIEAGAPSASLRVDSSGNVGIGTTSPVDTGSTYGDLTINGSVGAFISLQSNGSTTGVLQTIGTETRLSTSVASGYLTFRTDTGGAGSERARIDSSGNLLVGKTSTGIATEGAQFGGGQHYLTTDSDAPLKLNRLTTDGEILQLRKDGTVVGRIGSIGGVTSYIDGGSTYTGLAFNASSVAPRDAGAGTNGTVDLGVSSGRWKDLYLSGGVYLGGTGAANHLDDYEEGTWTPTLNFGGADTGNVYGSQTGRYTKIGNIVHVFVYVRLTTKGTATGNAELSGLPFYADANAEAGTALNLYNNLANVDTPIIGRISGFNIELREGTTSTVTRLNDTNFTNLGEVRLSATYRVS